MAKTKINDNDLLALCAMLRAREAKMLTPELAERMLTAAKVSEAAKMLEECGYPDLSDADVFKIEDTLSERRAAVYAEIAQTEAARPMVGLFMLKYDYHNVKAFVKSMGANEDATRILSASGRVSKTDITEAFITGERSNLPERLARAMSVGVGTLSRTSNPQMSDIAIDKQYYSELFELAEATGDDFVTGYARLVIDSANLRTFVRCARTGKTREFLQDALFENGNASVEQVLSLPLEGDGLSGVFKSDELSKAIALAKDVIEGGAQTLFERECDNAATRYIDRVRLVPFGKAVVLRYLLALDWEMTTIRMILSGRIAGVETETIRERLRDGYV